MADPWTLSAEGAQQFADRYLAYLADPSRDRTRKGEKQLCQRFWQDFFTQVCGVADTLLAGVEFEHPVRSVKSDTVGWVDVLWPGVLLVEHKSAGLSLDVAEEQARDYLLALEPKHRPAVAIVSDFERFRVIEVLAGRSSEFALRELPKNLNRFEAIFAQGGVGAGAETVHADARAAELMSDLYVEFENAGYDGHEVSIFLMRCLFLLFGDDTRLWRVAGVHGLFGSVVDASLEDGTGLGGQIQELFEVLDQSKDKRPTTLGPTLAEFPYVNGGLFTGPLRVFSFTREMRAALLAACDYDWSDISPAIFGAMFQNIKSQHLRRELGEHYTSEANILKVIGPLFLDELNARLDKAWDSVAALRRLHADLGTYTWLDPACGCGNFLLVAYKRLRALELRLVVRERELEGRTDRSLLGREHVTLRLSQFHGFEINEWSSQIAGVAMVLAEHQANMEMERVLGLAPDLLPLSDAAVFTHGNALREDWASDFEINDRTFIMGNPPFGGYHLQNEEQRLDTAHVWSGVKGQGVLDFVANWFLIAARHAARSGAKVAFVATNSISQGEQPPLLWGELYKLGMSIDFAHRTFRWSNGTNHQAAVHTVVVGFSDALKKRKRSLWSYPAVDGDPVLSLVSNINAYLIDAPDVLVTSRRTPLVPGIPHLRKGSIPTDGGFLSNISPKEAADIRREDPVAAKYLRRLIGAEEMLHGIERWCLWLEYASPHELRSSPEIVRRLEAVREMRLRSKKEKTRKDAERPWEFQEVRQPTTRYLAIPRHSSEGRGYLPVAFFEPLVIANDAVSIVDDDALLIFGITSTRIFRIWADAVSGRIKNDLRVSGEITYNNFPFPDLTPELRTSIETAAAGVLECRSFFVDSTLADLYEPTTMPTQLRRAHEELDRVVGRSLGIAAGATDVAVLDKLFERYGELISGASFFPTTPARRRRRAA